MKKIRRIFVLIFIFMILVLIFILNNNSNNIREMSENEREKLFGSPINVSENENIINNRYFSIDSSGKEPEATRQGINEVIEYANKNNIKQLKFEKGTYLINLSEENFGVVLKSNLELDFNGSTIMLDSNANTHSSVLYLNNIENVTLKNGIIVGDSQTHQFTGTSTHEWGYGIYIINGKNINTENIQIQNCIGDGILIDGKDSIDISILSCNIFDCRRQGISITSGKNIKIFSNEIHDIKGTDPQSGIDLEAYQENRTINNVEIKNNKIYNLNTDLAIIADRGTYNVNISENNIEGSIGVNCAHESVIINNNEMKNGMINVYESDNKIGVGNRINYVEIYNNNLKNFNIILGRIKKANIHENYIKDGTIQLSSTNAAVYNNEIENTKKNAKKYAYKYTISTKGNYIIYSINNEEKGDFETIILNEYKVFIVENNNVDELEKYLNSIKN